MVGDLEWQQGGSDFQARAIEALRGIPVRMISYGGSNYNISMVGRADDKVRALNMLNRHLFN